MKTKNNRMKKILIKYKVLVILYFIVISCTVLARIASFILGDPFDLSLYPIIIILATVGFLFGYLVIIPLIDYLNEDENKI